jgi:hypothetical protein
MSFSSTASAWTDPAGKASTTTTEAPGSHALYVSKPAVVADVVAMAARSVRDSAAALR